jgi:membrane associated rhomboid family serine protease
MVPFTLAILYVGVTRTSTDVGHFAHLFGFVFGGAYEAIYVFSEREQERTAGTEGSRQAPWQG